MSVAVVFALLEDPSSNISLVPFKLQVASSMSERERYGGEIAFSIIFTVEPAGIYVNKDDSVGSNLFSSPHRSLSTEHVEYD